MSKTNASMQARQKLSNDHPEIAKSIRWIWRIIGQDLGKKNPTSYAQGKAFTALTRLYPKQYERLRKIASYGGYHITHSHGFRGRGRL